jgi:tetratricopeptide (TPR) repeat protein
MYKLCLLIALAGIFVASKAQTIDSTVLQEIQALTSLANYAIALDKTEKGLKKFPESSVLLVEKGKILFCTGNFDGAISTLSTVIERKPEATAFFFRGRSYEAKGMVKEAEHDYDMAIKEAPKGENIVPYIACRGHLRLKNNDWKNAIRDFSKVLEVDPKDTASLFSRGFSRYNTKNYADAIEDFSAVLKANAKNVMAYYYRGQCNYQIEDYKATMKDCNKITEIDPANFDAIITRGWCRLRLGIPRSALPDFNRAIELRPMDAKGYYGRAVYYYSIKKENDACADYKKAISLGIKETDEFPIDCK